MIGLTVLVPIVVTVIKKIRCGVDMITEQECRNLLLNKAEEANALVFDIAVSVIMELEKRILELENKCGEENFHSSPFKHWLE